MIKRRNMPNRISKHSMRSRDENFGNARDVRNVFERAVARQSDRVAALEKPGKEELMALTVADLQEEGGPVPDGAPDETLP